MDARAFKSLVAETLEARGFRRKGDYFQKDASDVAIVVGVQKSAHSNAFYLIVGFILRELAPGRESFRDVDGDVRARFSFARGDTRTDLFDPKDLEEAHLTKVLEENVEDLIGPISSVSDLTALIQRRPALRLQTKLAAKPLLGIA